MADSSIPDKQCSVCKQYFPPTTEYFPVQKSVKCGLKARCKTCNNAGGRKYHADHREEVNAKARLTSAAQYQKHKPKIREYYKQPHVKARVQQRNRDWRKNNPEKVKAISKKFRITHHEKRVKELQDWRNRNPDKVKAQNKRAKRDPLKSRAKVHTRRIRKKERGGSFSKHDVLLQYKSQKGLCWWCDKPVGDNYHIDHRVPLAKGGSNLPNNLVISCPHCNLSKRDKLPHEWNGRLL